MTFGYYPGIYKSKFMEMYVRILGIPFPERRLENLLMWKMMLFEEGEKILDVGCGDGLLLPQIAKMGCKIEGVDLSPNALEEAKRRVEHLNISKQIKLRKGSAEKLDYEDQSFDKVICNCTLEHIENDEKALNEMIRVLKIDGNLFLTVPVNKLNETLLNILFKLPKQIRKLFCKEIVNEAKNQKEVIINFLKSNYHARIGYDEKILISTLEKKKMKVIGLYYYIKKSSILFQLSYYTKLGSPPLIAIFFPILYTFGLLDHYLSRARGRAFAIVAQKEND